ncbi:MAG: DNA mismatch repair protein MutS [Pseudomonadota bacterium]
MLSIQEFRTKYNYTSHTSVMKQYLDIKFEHQDTLLFFRVGDFYELFFEDAVDASAALGIVLTSRRSKAQQSNIQMCGVPHSALNSYAFKLVEAGYKVAICDQADVDAMSPGISPVDKILKRDVVRILTPGTISEESLIDAAVPHYLVSIASLRKRVSIAYLDISVSEFCVSEVDINQLATELGRLNPKEILITCTNLGSNKALQPYLHIMRYRSKNSEQMDSRGPFSDTQKAAIDIIYEYIKHTQKNNLPHLPAPKLISINDFMTIDPSTRRNLELVASQNGGRKNSLLGAIDCTITKQGARLLYQYLSSPLANIDKINKRLDITEFFYLNSNLLDEVRNILKNSGDVERILSRISMNRANVLDLLQIKFAISKGHEIIEAFTNNIGVSYPSYIEQVLKPLYGNTELLQIIDSSTSESDASIKPSYHPKLLELHNLLKKNEGVLDQLKLKYSKITEIPNLNISHNNILGLFIEIMPKYISKITDPVFIHKQTTASAVRFTTAQMQQIESDMVNAKALADALEKEIFESICKTVLERAENLRKLAYSISALDVFCSLARHARAVRYTRPTLTNDQSFEILGARHPVVEKNIQAFVPNDCNLSGVQRIWLLTGPNMAGKSTFLRQNALLVLLAQIGSFVPASFARIGIVDKIFSRIGSSDDLYKGQSTFMVEMTETSAILANATSRSLIILDELGCGTSTDEGVAIALGCIEYIHDIITCRCLFATHYHELTYMTSHLQSLQKYTADIRGNEDGITFLHKIIKGVANSSYGIFAASQAGLPQAVIERAYEVLKSHKKE